MVVLEKINKVTKCRVHLHVHLDGALRTATIWELSRQKKLPLPGDGSLKDLEEALCIRAPRDLAFFLSKFDYISPAVRGDLEAIERIAFEFVEDESRQGVIYTEPRFSPHLLTSQDGDVTARQVLQAVLRGIERGEKQTGTTARVILCCIIGMQDKYQSVLDLCTEFKGRVVGIDIAGDEAAVANAAKGEQLIEFLEPEIAVFREAARRGVHRTVHAGESGPAHHIKVALDQMKAERIGHGYHVLEDDKLYRHCVEKGVHFECCVNSSYMTGSVPLTQTKHPIQRFCEDGASFSANEDDPTVTQQGLDGEYNLLRRMGFNEANIVAMNFNAAKACFLPEDEKAKLIQKLRDAFGVPCAK